MQKLQHTFSNIQHKALHMKERGKKLANMKRRYYEKEFTFINVILDLFKFKSSSFRTSNNRKR